MWYLREKDEVVCRAGTVQDVLELYRPADNTMVTAVRLTRHHNIIVQRAFYSQVSGRWLIIEGRSRVCIYDFAPLRNAHSTLLSAANDCR
nr:MAG TPA: hypothetical protein [Caudoviricetes sp.]